MSRSPNEPICSNRGLNVLEYARGIDKHEDYGAKAIIIIKKGQDGFKEPARSSRRFPINHVTGDVELQQWQ